MQYSRIYHPDNLSINKIVMLGDGQTQHVGAVLRLKIKDKLILFNGQGVEYLAEICEITKKKISVYILSKDEIDRESSLSLHLGQAVSRADKMDWTLQKAVELGVKEITPLITQYTLMNIKICRQKLSHWEKIIISSCEQCGRNTLPVLHPPLFLTEWLSLLSTHPLKCALLFDPRGAVALSNANLPLSKKTIFYLLIGPEGGLNQDECTLAQEAHFQSVHLGNRILRTETAAVAAVSALQALRGDFR